MSETKEGVKEEWKEGRRQFELKRCFASKNRKSCSLTTLSLIYAKCEPLLTDKIIMHFAEFLKAHHPSLLGSREKNACDKQTDRIKIRTKSLKLRNSRNCFCLCQQFAQSVSQPHIKLIIWDGATFKGVPLQYISIKRNQIFLVIVFFSAIHKYSKIKLFLSIVFLSSCFFQKWACNKLNMSKNIGKIFFFFVEVFGRYCPTYLSSPIDTRLYITELQIMKERNKYEIFLSFSLSKFPKKGGKSLSCSYRSTCLIMIEKRNDFLINCHSKINLFIPTYYACAGMGKCEESRSYCCWWLGTPYTKQRLSQKFNPRSRRTFRIFPKRFKVLTTWQLCQRDARAIFFKPFPSTHAISKMHDHKSSINHTDS